MYIVTKIYGKGEDKEERIIAAFHSQQKAGEYVDALQYYDRLHSLVYYKLKRKDLLDVLNLCADKAEWLTRSYYISYAPVMDSEEDDD